VARLINPGDLVGAAEIAERLGLSHAPSVHAWRRRYEDFPEPVAELRMGLIWAWKDVEAWARRTGRLPS
jgi:chromosome partitioning protein